jgi:hypothetical protein
MHSMVGGRLEAMGLSVANSFLGDFIRPCVDAEAFDAASVARLACGR